MAEDEAAVNHAKRCITSSKKVMDFFTYMGNRELYMTFFYL